MEPKTRIRVLQSAPPQYACRTGLTLERKGGAYWAVRLDGLETPVALHQDEIVVDPPKPPATQELDLSAWDQAMGEVGF